jgi:hypothetical protein
MSGKSETYNHIPTFLNQTPPHHCRKSLPLPLLTVLFHQFLSPVRRKKKTNRVPFVVENRKNRPKKVLLYQTQTVKIQIFCSYFLHQPVFTDDGGAAAVVTTKNTAVEPTTRTVDGTSQAEEKAHLEVFDLWCLVDR